MRAEEFIREARVLNKPKLDGSQSAAMPLTHTYPALNGHYYDMYKFGVAAAMSPDQEHDYAKNSFGPALLTLSYTAADQEILKKAAKIMGVKSEKINSSHSEEQSNINATSPMKPQGPIKRKK